MPRTRMTEGVFDDMAEPAPEGVRHQRSGQRVAARRLARQSPQCDVTGRVFEIVGGRINVCDGWQHGHAVDIGRKYDLSEVGAAVRESIAKTPLAGTRLRRVAAIVAAAGERAA